MIDKRVLDELIIEQQQCNELFDIAFKCNGNENTRTELSQKVTSYMCDLTQTLSCLIGEIQCEIWNEQMLEITEKLGADYDSENPYVIKNCRTCVNNVEYPPPHTCDVCDSLDEELYCMWEPKIDK